VAFALAFRDFYIKRAIVPLLALFVYWPVPRAIAMTLALAKECQHLVIAAIAEI
jgi:hypothetical protein